MCIKIYINRTEINFWKCEMISNFRAKYLKHREKNDQYMVNYNKIVLKVIKVLRDIYSIEISLADLHNISVIFDLQK